MISTDTSHMLRTYVLLLDYKLVRKLVKEYRYAKPLIYNLLEELRKRQEVNLVFAKMAAATTEEAREESHKYIRTCTELIIALLKD